MNKKQLIVVWVIGIIFLIGGCGNRWNGVYYPEGLGWGRDEKKWKFSTIFHTKEECLNWCAQESNPEKYPNEYCECGKNCKADHCGGQVCKETVDAYRP